MTNKAEKSVAVAVIKWTDEEWTAIARQLHSTMGSALLASEHLEEVKAKDVFTAQETALPEHRHRKLISISQGFQAIRQKLKNILSETTSEPPAHAGTQEQLFTQPVPPTARSGSDSEEDIAGESAIAMNDIPSHSTHSQPATVHSAAAQPASVQPSGNADDILDTSHAHESGSGSETGMSGKVNEEHPATRDTGPSAAAMAKPHAATSPVRQNNTRPAVAPRGAHRNEERVEPASGANLVEIARPFVAMVCQELARALVDALAQSKSPGTLSALVQQAVAQAGSGQPPSQMPADVRPMHHAASTDEDDTGVAESEVQPLFDPKLPPSANSSFKPTVGVVGANAHDFDELQQMYPQLLLTAVAVDDVPHANSLRQCQRIIGLREDVPAKTDEILRRIFRNRYLRLTGGMERVREQLDAWLDKPGSIDAGRPTPRKPRKPGNGPKKRHGNYPPRTPR
ncbi:hypothetical protein [Noviherbaspirillum saxi]|nr:hypothetical protein [Noviherbaspirillum saxi]